MHDNLT